MPTEDSQEGQTPEEAKGSSSKLLLIGIGLLIVVAAVLGGLYFLGSSEEPTNTEPVQVEEKVNEVLQIQPFVVNLADDAGIHYLRLGIGFGIFNPGKDATTIDEDVLLPKMKDYLLRTIGQKTAAQMVSPQGREDLREQILAGANEILSPLDKGKVLEVYLTEFIVQ